MYTLIADGEEKKTSIGFTGDPGGAGWGVGFMDS